ncbi:hypothetical protein ACP6PL_11580 [Dapis sp. BLCC M126]
MAELLKSQLIACAAEAKDRVVAIAVVAAAAVVSSLVGNIFC